MSLLRPSWILLLLVAARLHAAPLAASENDSTSRLPLPTAPAASKSASGDVVRSPLVPKAPRPLNGNGDASGETPSLVAPVLGTILGGVVIGLGIFCANSETVQNAFSSKPENGHTAALVTGSGLVLGGVAIVSASLVQLGKAL